MQLDASSRQGQPFLHELGMMITRVVQENMDMCCCRAKVLEQDDLRTQGNAQAKQDEADRSKHAVAEANTPEAKQDSRPEPAKKQAGALLATSAASTLSSRSRFRTGYERCRPRRW